MEETKHSLIHDEEEEYDYYYYYYYYYYYISVYIIFILPTGNIVVLTGIKYYL
jgi:hypothetical protein